MSTNDEPMPNGTAETPIETTIPQKCAKCGEIIGMVYYPWVVDIICPKCFWNIDSASINGTTTPTGITINATDDRGNVVESMSVPSDPSHRYWPETLEIDAGGECSVNWEEHHQIMWKCAEFWRADLARIAELEKDLSDERDEHNWLLALASRTVKLAPGQHNLPDRLAAIIGENAVLRDKMMELRYVIRDIVECLNIQVDCAKSTNAEYTNETTARTMFISRFIRSEVLKIIAKRDLFKFVDGDNDDKASIDKPEDLIQQMQDPAHTTPYSDGIAYPAHVPTYRDRLAYREQQARIVELEAQLAASQAREATLREAIYALTSKLVECHSHERYKSVWLCAHNHLGPYNGPTYITELEQAHAALAATTDKEGGEG